MFLGRTSQIVGEFHISYNKCSTARISVEMVLHRTLLDQTIGVVLYRGRPDNGGRPDESSSQLARTITANTGVVGLQFLSRIVVTNGSCCDFTSSNGV